MSVQGKIFAIKQYALHDGPNIRTTIFLKGCPLRCWWCHNPEGLDAEISLLWDGNQCIGCGTCYQQCPAGALQSQNASMYWDRSLCTACSHCLTCCPAVAWEATGRWVDVEEVLAALRKDVPFYDQSGGGVTFSGGEPLMQPVFLKALLQACGRLDIHRVVDTSGLAPTAELLEIAQDVDLFLFDLKQMDNEKHQLYTGVGNRLILHNLQRLCQQGQHIQIRLPLIPGINDDSENLEATGAFVCELPGVTSLDLLPYHPSALSKYQKLALDYPGKGIEPDCGQSVTHAQAILEKYGLTVRIGG